MLDNTSSFSALVKKEAPHVTVSNFSYADMHWHERFFQQPQKKFCQQP
jgi:hypothetical protein